MAGQHAEQRRADRENPGHDWKVNEVGFLKVRPSFAFAKYHDKIPKVSI